MVFACVSITTFWWTLVFRRWHHKDESVFIMVHYETNTYTKFINLSYVSWIHVFLRPKAFCVSRLHAVTQGCSFLLLPIYQHFLHIFASFFRHVQTSQRGLVSNSCLLFKKRASVAQIDENMDPGVTFFNLQNSRRELLFCRICILSTIHVPMYGFSGIVQRFST